MAKFASSIFRWLQSSAPRHLLWSGEVETEGEKQAGVCAENNLLISLPDDLLFKILFKLSAQDIYRASLVCRSLYYHTIRSDEFINLHLRQTDDEYGLLFPIVYAPTREYCQCTSQQTVFVSMKQGRVTVSDYYHPYKSIFIFHNSCNGLVVPEHMCFVTNPVTGRALRLPPFPKKAMFANCFVGYAEASKAYKVILVQTDAGIGLPAWWHILTVGVDRSWRNLTESTLTGGDLKATEGFIHSIFWETVLTLNVETEVMTETWAQVPVYNPMYMKTRSPVSPVYPPKFMKRWFLSTGKSLTVVVKVEHGVFRVWEMVCGDYNNYYYWRKWERPIVLRLEEIREVCGDKYYRSNFPVGWLQQMEVLVFKVRSKKGTPSKVFYVVVATGEIGWIDPISSNKERLVEKFYDITVPIVPHRNTLVRLEGCY